MNILPLSQTDYYKVNHYGMYDEYMVNINSNLTPRKSRLKGVDGVVVFGIQYFLLEYLIKQWNEEFFNNPNAITKYKRLVDFTLGPGTVDVSHIQKLHDLGFLPLEIRALPEGSICPIGVPCMTIQISDEFANKPLKDGGFGWLVNYLETIASCTLWLPITSATIAHQYRKLLNMHALKTVGNTDFVQWQGHDFSFRGHGSLESAMISGAGHLLSFTGTDTIPAIEFMEEYYGANIETELVGASVPATEHSIMCIGMKDNELETFSRLLDTYIKSPVLSIVSDTWDLWKVCTEYLPALKEQILARDGKLVIRPDSGDPVAIICGWKDTGYTKIPDGKEYSDYEHRGVIELLWDVFGGTINEQGYKVLDPHIGAIYGDAITLERAKEICERLEAKGFASTNVVFGIGSFTYQGGGFDSDGKPFFITRDLFGFAVKATYGEVLEYVSVSDHEEGNPGLQPVGRNIFKDPITDDGTKKSAKGLLFVGYDNERGYYLEDQVSKEKYKSPENQLQIVFKNGTLTKRHTLSEIRERLKNQ